MDPLSDSVQIQCSRQIETDTVQSSRSCIFADTVQSSGLGPCASLAAYNSFASFLSKRNDTAHVLKHPLPIIFHFCRRRYGLVTAGLHAAIWSMREEHTECLGRTRPKHHIFRESRFWCFEGSWERKRRSLGLQTPLSYFSLPSKFTAARYAATSPRGGLPAGQVFTAARYAATSPRCPVCLKAKYLCALALLHLIHSIEAKKKHQEGRTMTTAQSALSAPPATTAAGCTHTPTTTSCPTHTRQPRTIHPNTRRPPPATDGPPSRRGVAVTDHGRGRRPAAGEVDRGGGDASKGGGSQRRER